MLDDVERFVRRFVAFPSDAAAVAAVVWAAHTHAIDCFASTPRLAVVSPEKGSGKSRLAVDVMNLLVREPMKTANCTPAALFRSIEARQPTVLFDEVDTVFGVRAGPNEDLRAMLNAGYRRSGSVTRCVGEKHEVKDFPVFAAVALAGIGDLPDTVADRSVIIRMRKRAPYELVEQFRDRDITPQGEALRKRLSEWAERNKAELTQSRPEMPDGIMDRPADVWEPLFAVADAAGGAWPERVRVAALELLDAQASEPTTPGVQLLWDIHKCMSSDDGERLDRIFSDDLVKRLVAMEEAQWGDLNGKALDQRGLARRLKKYEIRPKEVRIGDETRKGYRREWFEDVWPRYVPALREPKQPEQPEQGRSGTVRSGDSMPRDVPDVSDVSGSLEDASVGKDNAMGEWRW